LKNIGIVCCDVQEELAFIGLSTNEISIFSIPENKVLYSFNSYNGKTILVIFLDE